MNIKKLITAGIMAVAAMYAFAEPTVTDVVAKQRYPWNGLVDINCTVSGIGEATNGYKFVVVAVDKDSGKEYTATHCTVEKGGTGVSGWEVSVNGDYALLWDARTDMGQVIVERMTVRVTLEAVLSDGKVQLWEDGPYWADRNIGADKPWDYGLYFWWGDTTGHSPSAGGTFSFNFDYDNSAIYTYGKSVSGLQSAGWVTSGGVLAPAHDAAHVKWGGNWRMPTKQEFDDLNNKCDWTWTARNGVNGYIVRGRGAYADRSIFLPCAGTGNGASLYESGLGRYRSSVPDSGSYNDYELFFGSGYHRTVSYSRCLGLSVRPVQGFAN